MDPATQDESEPVDFNTRDWLVPASHTNALQDLVDIHRVLPLVVYDENEAFILPENMQVSLLGALVKITFSLCHYVMGGKDNSEKFDCFLGWIKQIVVLHPPGPPLPSPFRNFKQRSPWCPKNEVPESPTKKTWVFKLQSGSKPQGNNKENELDSSPIGNNVFTEALHGAQISPLRTG
ncbi:hypothetical protein NP233_g12697 [Leucocoprinus birnbaumii]|uniref:Uncharacterized protein n=1 Tax=Leucocoprinus birnbaumii TaxID=56174 RepID=A0AAD5VE57_9AGAR|nr:hypothetical protein NP233_g12697 [Leucocoprinus birnbaumii]